MELVVGERGVGVEAVDGHDELVLLLRTIEGDGAGVFGAAEVLVGAVDDLGFEAAFVVVEIFFVGQQVVAVDVDDADWVELLAVGL